MLKIQEIREIIKLIDQSNIDEFSYEQEGAKLKLKKKGEVHTVVASAPTPAPAPVTSAAVEAPIAAAATPAAQPVKEETKPVEDTNLHKITSPMVGTFYASPSPDASAYVQVGDKVSENSVVCIVEAMKLFNEIEAEVKGEVVEILVENGQLVEYGQPLFLVKQA
ncbi:acetyl-CoA carboxylase biotin carboxyl carrier protein [Sutcliffiella cohnii]|uniref:acetyl-CoA carboxylase biotin carboxyl carrier protein n=1 Tax=Sutcliffiella cohnii TaxID=33932 RepID=UPI002E250969|nr:acetyl-CoA carboxylase biotin carboxyl carrier protein [Sutcliffiella cohnii]MED4017077.1 acetyl-CoA carboxylase biotin carboxyl carrier protein [Sutcliffiella cohnii]